MDLNITRGVFLIPITLLTFLWTWGNSIDVIQYVYLKSGIFYL